MGAAPSRPGEGAGGGAPGVDRALEHGALRQAFPRGLEDDRCKELKHALSWCLQSNNWYFTGGGLVVGSVLSYFMRSTRPIGIAAVLSPACDWVYGQYVCRECAAEYNAYRKQLMEQYRLQAQEIREQLRGGAS